MRNIFEEFIKQIEWNQEAVVVQNPYKPAQIVSMAYANIEKCELYHDYYWGWSCKPRLEKTWSNFKDHFARLFKETRRSSRTSKTKGYAANVQSAQANAALFAKMQQDHTMALANIATEIQANRTPAALLTKTIAKLSSQVTTLIAKLKLAQSYNARLKISRHCLSPDDHGHRSANAGAPSDQNPLRDRNIYSRSGKKFDPNRYCSYHGFKFEESHTSAICHYPLDGRGWTPREERHGTNNGSMAGQPSGGGRYYITI